MTTSRRNLIITFLVLGAAAVAWRGWPTQDTTSKQRYRTQSVDRGDIVQRIAANGTLNPVVLVNVGTQVSGTVYKVHADFNDRVDAGQVMAELDPSLFQAQVKQSEANLLNAQASLALARIKLGRTDTLYQKKLIAKEELDIARQQVDAATAQVKLAEAQLERDRINLRNSVIRSPISGVVVARSVDVGQTVAASFQTPTLFQIAQDLRRMQIYTNVAEADVGNPSTSNPVSFTVDAFPERNFQGRIRQIRLNPTVQQNVVTYNVVVDVDNEDGRLMPGMTAYVLITVSERKDVLRIPNTALSFRPREDEESGGRPSSRAAGTQVYVLEQNDTLRPVPVKTGITDNTVTQVIDGGLQPGDRVVTRETGERKDTGNFRIRVM